MQRRTVPTIAAALTGVVLLAAPAAAHVEIEPAETPARDTARLEFVVDHGCHGGSDRDTVGLEVTLPEGVTDPDPEPAEGWDVEVDGATVTWSSGRLDHHTEGRYAMTVRLPDAEGETVWFPTLQRCGDDTERWIEIAADAAAAAALPNPAPHIVLTAAAASTPEEPTQPEPAPTTAPVAEPDEAPGSDIDDPADDPADGPANDLTDDANDDVALGDDGGGGGAAWIWLVAAIAGALAVAAGVVAVRRRGQAPA